MGRRMVRIEVVHDGGWIEQISTDDPLILGEWLLYTAHRMPERERSLRGNWSVTPWEQEG